MDSTKKRQSNIELLRVITMLGVIILHYNNPSIGGAMKYAVPGSLNFYVLYILESVFVCAVDLFALISGFFLCTSYKRSCWKVIELLVQVILFSEAIYAFKVIIGVESFSAKKIVLHLIPSNYFVILYIAVFLISPFINKLLDNITKKQFNMMLVLLLFIFSIEPTIVDVLGEMKNSTVIGLSFVGMYGSQWGYSVVNFILMYIVGAYLRKNIDSIKNISYSKLFIILTICVAIMTIWSRVNDRIGYITEKTAWEYCNPVVILSACIIFVCFYKMDIGYRGVVNKLAAGAFSVFLLHNPILSLIGINKYVNMNCAIMLIHIIICALAIYLICWCIWWVYDKIMSVVYNVLKKRIHIPDINVE